MKTYKRRKIGLRYDPHSNSLIRIGERISSNSIVFIKNYYQHLVVHLIFIMYHIDKRYKTIDRWAKFGSKVRKYQITICIKIGSIGLTKYSNNLILCSYAFLNFIYISLVHLFTNSSAAGQKKSQTQYRNDYLFHGFSCIRNVNLA